jgi:magnesium transporter
MTTARVEAPEPATMPTSSCKLTVVELDFEQRVERAISLDEAASSMKQGRFVWIDLDAADPDEGKRILAALGLVGDDVVELALREEPSTQYGRYDDYVHLVVSGYRRRGEDFDFERVSISLGERFLLTTHRGPVQFLTNVRRDYHADFVRFAKTPSFLLYELLDHLVENYLDVQQAMGERVERLQAELGAGEVDDSLFARASQLGADLLHFRKVLLPTRATLADLSSRRSLVLSEATQRFLGNMVGSVDHLLQDMLVDRDILSESLNLYMSMVGHRTNQVMKKLTAVSIVFLPLTFLVGVYGMNFEVFPELKWRFGYVYFWAVVATVIFVLIRLLRKSRVL